MKSEEDDAKTRSGKSVVVVSNGRSSRIGGCIMILLLGLVPLFQRRSDLRNRQGSILLVYGS